MTKILFLIHDLGHGGAEKVLVNLVNNMDKEKFDITVCTLFGEGVNEQFLEKHIHRYSVFPKEVPGNSKLMKLLTPKQLHKMCVRGTYDIEVAYLEGPSARVISGCTDKNTKTVCWIHGEQKDRKYFASSFRSYNEAIDCYREFDRIFCVSQTVKEDFFQLSGISENVGVLYNVNESDKILSLSENECDIPRQYGNVFKLVTVGRLIEVKGYKRLIKIIGRLVKENYNVHLFILGDGKQKDELQQLINDNNLNENVTLLGYDTNPYKYVSKCDLFVCSSFAEGFSTAATEALIVGTPVCTVEVSGMKEMLGENNEYGVITQNNEDALYEGIKSLLESKALLEHYKKQAVIRGKTFSMDVTVGKHEDMFIKLLG